MGTQEIETELFTCFAGEIKVMNEIDYFVYVYQ